MIDSWERGEYLITTDRSRLDVDLIHNFLSTQTYWAVGRSVEVVKRSIDNSFCFGIYRPTEQVGFARVVTDFATFAWLADVFVIPEHRARGLAKWLMEVILAHPELQGFRRWVLATKMRIPCISNSVSFHFTGLSAGWNDPIRICARAPTTGIQRTDH